MVPPPGHNPDVVNDGPYVNGPADFAEVEPAAELPVRPGEHDRPDFVTHLGLRQGVDRLLDPFEAERVAELRQVEGDPGDTLDDVELDATVGGPRRGAGGVIVHALDPLTSIGDARQAGVRSRLDAGASSRLRRPAVENPFTRGDLRAPSVRRLPYNRARRALMSNVTVLTGGSSFERNVALAGAGLVAAALRSRGHRVVVVDTVRGPVSRENEERWLDPALGVLPPTAEELDDLRKRDQS